MTKPFTDFELAENFDPDEILAVSQSYSGQVSLWDECLGIFLDSFQSSALAESTLLMLLGARGYPLGEHPRIGACDGALYNELIQIPWVV